MTKLIIFQEVPVEGQNLFKRLRLDPVDLFLVPEAVEASVFLRCVQSHDPASSWCWWLEGGGPGGGVAPCQMQQQ